MQLGEDAAHHIRVRRLEVGDAVYVANGAGAQAIGAIVAITKKDVDVSISEVFFSDQPAAVHLVVPIADRDRMLWCAEKCTELGATSWRPVMWNRSKSVSPRGEGEAFRVRVRNRMTSALVCHPGPTVGYRITDARGSVLTYLPDHEPALGASAFPSLPLAWTSGGSLAANADLLIHDSQYSAAEYINHVGWGHSSFKDALAFAALSDVKHFVPFHHDPAHTDIDIDRMMKEALALVTPACRVTTGR